MGEVTAPDIAAIARGLSDYARMGLRNTYEQRLMGGFYGLAWTDPELVEAVGINHPIFGSHYRLTPLGLRVRSHLLETTAMSEQELMRLPERCEAATGADRELDITIKAAVFGGVALMSPFNGEWCVYRAGTTDPRAGKTIERPRSLSHEQWITDRYSASLDAAMTLVPEGWGWHVTAPADAGLSTLVGVVPSGARVFDGSKGINAVAAGDTPALALCAAALRARAQVQS